MTIGSFVQLLSALILFLSLNSCARYMPSELHQICLRTERLGHAYGRTVMFNSRGASNALKRHPHSHRGACVAGAQGEPKGLEVCLVKSTECGKDRHTRVWDDQWPWYMEEYPGSYMCQDQSANSTCQECVMEPDDCHTGAGGPEPRNDCLQYDNFCEDPFTIENLGPGETPLLPKDPPPKEME